MKIILSPAKNMKIKRYEGHKLYKPIFIKQTKDLHKILKEFSSINIESLMKVNPKIAFNTYCKFQDFDINAKMGHAIISYDGLAYKSLDAQNFTKDDVLFANENIRIISAFYGILTPLTNISHYRLEMGLKMNVNSHKSLYCFWQNRIYEHLYKNNDIIINLASKEYSKVITPFLVDNNKFIDIEFYTNKNGKHKIIATSAKIARGAMANYIVKNKIKDIEKIKNFRFDGYCYNKFLSNENKLIFIKS